MHFMNSQLSSFKKLTLRFFTKNTYLRSFLTPTLVLTLYCYVYQFLAGKYLPMGVSHAFTNRLWKYILIFCLCSLPFFLYFQKRNPESSFSKAYKKKIFFFGDFLLLLLPLTPISQYILNNQAILTPLDSVLLFAIFLTVCALIIIVIPFLLNKVGSSFILKIIGVIFTLTICSMPLLSQQFNWYEYGSLKVQLVFMVFVFLLFFIFYRGKKRWYLLAIISVFFLSNVILNLYHYLEKNKPAVSAGENLLLENIKGKKPLKTPNIYLLVYDAYVPNETMLSYGIDNSLQEDFLTNNGFILYPNTYSIGATSIDSMSLVLNAANDFYGNHRRGVSGDGIVQNALEKIGYTTYGVFPYYYFFYEVGSSYDVSYPDSNPSKLTFMPLLNAILVGEFRFEFTLSEEMTDSSHNEYVSRKQDSLRAGLKGPSFIYSHSNIPNHSQNSGACLPNETQLYQERLNEANQEMKADVKQILDHDPGSIIIIAGDHGPYLTKNCVSLTDFYEESEINRQDIQDRHATFLAIRWAEDDNAQYDDITVLQDVFPAIFAFMFEDRQIIMNSKVPAITKPFYTGGVYVNNGVIVGGANDNEPLFLTQKK